MTLLITGVLLFACIHLVPVVRSDFRSSLINKLGLLPYKGGFALLSLGSFFMITRGWQSATPEFLYALPGVVWSLNRILMTVAVLLFVTSVYPTHLKQWVRHPQLTAVIIFAIAHLLVNGDTRSLLLFGGLGIWAVLEMVFINRRDGAWVKGKPVNWALDILGFVLALVVLVGIIFSHVYIAGVPLM